MGLAHRSPPFPTPFPPKNTRPRAFLPGRAFAYTSRRKNAERWHGVAEGGREVLRGLALERVAMQRVSPVALLRSARCTSHSLYPPHTNLFPHRVALAQNQHAFSDQHLSRSVCAWLLARNESRLRDTSESGLKDLGLQEVKCQRARGGGFTLRRFRRSASS